MPLKYRIATQVSRLQEWLCENYEVAAQGYLERSSGLDIPGAAASVST